LTPRPAPPAGPRAPRDTVNDTAPPVPDQREAALALFTAIRGRDDGVLFEIRSLPSGRQKWFDVADPEAALCYAFSEAPFENVYTGGAPRVPAEGRKQTGANRDVERVWMLSVDCDTDQSLEELGRFDPTPSIVIESGGCTESAPVR
jgi:hypothetical protein